VDVQLRKTMGGYKREDVIEYIDSLVQKYEKQLSFAREETEAAKREAEAAMQENASLFKKLSTLTEERDSVSRAVIAAQKEADAILENARLEGEALLNAKKEEVRAEEEKLQALRNEIRTMRLSASASLRKYEAALGEISMLSDDEEEEEE